MEKEINNINLKKATIINRNCPKIFKQSYKVSASVLDNLFNQ